jgi:hypothetical protein
MAKLTPEDRQEIVESLVANQIITEDGKPAIEAMTDVALLNFADATLNTEPDDDDDDDDDIDDDDSGSDETDVTNEDETPTGNGDGMVCSKCGASHNKKKGEKPMTGNRGSASQPKPQSKPQSFDEWMNSAPAEVQEVVANAANVMNDQKAELIKKLIDNSDLNDREKKGMVANLAGESLNKLKVMVSLIPKKPEPVANNGKNRIEPGNQIPGVSARFNFSGAGNPTINKKTTESQTGMLIPPTTNWEEAAKALK